MQLDWLLAIGKIQLRSFAAYIAIVFKMKQDVVNQKQCCKQHCDLIHIML